MRRMRSGGEPQEDYRTHGCSNENTKKRSSRDKQGLDPYNEAEHCENFGLKMGCRCSGCSTPQS